MGTNGGLVNNQTLAELDILQNIGATGCRTNLYPGAYLSNGNNWSQPTPESLDAFMSEAARRSILPVLLLEYYAPQYINSTDGFGSRAQWEGIGRAFAQHLRPGGTWARLNPWAPVGFGVTHYTAFNEPDGGTGFTTGSDPGPEAYAQALLGFSAGVKSVDASLYVAPGGFMAVNAHGDCTLNGLGKVLAPLWNNNHLDAVDLHTYFDVQYAPMNQTHRNSAAANFNCVLQANNVTAEGLRFASTEFNFKRRLVNETQAASGFLTSIWDNLGVTRDPSQMVASGTPLRPLTAMAFPWNIFNLASKDGNYGMAVSDTPYRPTDRGSTLALTLKLLNADEWAWVFADPFHRGMYKLSSSTQSLLAWQKRDYWSNVSTDDSIQLEDLPSNAVTVDVYGWDGLRRSLAVPRGSTTVKVGGLQARETLMFHVHGGAPGVALALR